MASEETKSKEEPSGIKFHVIGKVYYLEGEGLKKGHCYICGKKRKTTAHHLVPKRMQCKHPVLSEMRIRLCSECEDQMHPENRIIKESEVIPKLQKNIENLKNAVYWREMKMNEIQRKLEGYKLSVLAFFQRKEKEAEELFKKIDEIKNMKDEEYYRPHEPTKIEDNGNIQ